MNNTNKMSGIKKSNLFHFFQKLQGIKSSRHSSPEDKRLNKDNCCSYNYKYFKKGNNAQNLKREGGERASEQRKIKNEQISTKTQRNNKIKS